MFSPNSRIYSESKENGMSKAKKPDLVTMSVKKPFSDISVNKTTEKKSLKSYQTKQPTFNKVETTVVVEKSLKENYPDWLDDVSFYKEVEDSYEDILPKSERISRANIANILQCFTPPVGKPIEFDPMFLAVPRDNSFEKPDFKLEPMQLNDDDIPIPDIFCDFAF